MSCLFYTFDLHVVDVRQVKALYLHIHVYRPIANISVS